MSCPVPLRGGASKGAEVTSQKGEGRCEPGLEGHSKLNGAWARAGGPGAQVSGSDTLPLWRRGCGACPDWSVPRSPALFKQGIGARGLDGGAAPPRVPMAGCSALCPLSAADGAKQAATRTLAVPERSPSNCWLPPLSLASSTTAATWDRLPPNKLQPGPVTPGYHTTFSHPNLRYFSFLSFFFLFAWADLGGGRGVGWWSSG